MPGPSFRPILGAIGSTLLVFGFVVGGWLLAAGVVVLIITLLGLAPRRPPRMGGDGRGRRDRAHRERTGAALAAADVARDRRHRRRRRRVGLRHPAPRLRQPPGRGRPVRPGRPGAAGQRRPRVRRAAAQRRAIDADVVITAQGIAWATPTVTAPAGKAFKLALDNKDHGVPHDIVIKDQAGAQVFKTDVVTGPKAQVFDAPALQPARYPFVCSIHPNMTGTLTAS